MIRTILTAILLVALGFAFFVFWTGFNMPGSEAIMRPGGWVRATSEMEAKRDQLQTEILSASGQLADIKAETNQRSAIVADLRQQSAVLTDQVNTAQNQLDQLQQDIAAAQLTWTNLQGQFTSAACQAQPSTAIPAVSCPPVETSVMADVTQSDVYLQLQSQLEAEKALKKCTIQDVTDLRVELLKHFRQNDWSDKDWADFASAYVDGDFETVKIKVEPSGETEFKAWPSPFGVRFSEANLLAFVRDQEGGKVEARVYTVGDRRYTVVTDGCSCVYLAVGVKPQPRRPVHHQPSQPRYEAPVVHRTCPEQITVNVSGGANCTGACAAAKAAEAAARAAIHGCN